MKKLYLVIILIFCASSLFAQIKRYDMKSGIVEYEISGKGNVMGMTTTISGESKVFFKNYGALELSEEKTSQNIMGQQETNHDITKFENDTVYSVDFEEEVIYKQKISDSQKDMVIKETNEESLKNLGGKKIGTEKVAGFECDVWQLKNAKMSIYKGIPLKIESSAMGITQVQKAKLAKFNISVSADNLKLPNFPIKSQKAVMQSQMEGMSPEQKKMMQDMMKNMGGMFGNK